MKYDANNPKNIPINTPLYDVCVVGAGAAGITIATELGKLGHSVALCEAGGMEHSDESQDSYAMNVIGDPLKSLQHGRLRYFGGTTNHWGGWCRSFEPIDFDRGYLGELYQWPIKFDEINTYLDTACNIIGFPNNYAQFDKNRHESIKELKFHFLPTKFAKKYNDTIVSSQLIDLYLNANLIGLKGDAGNITSAEFVNYNGIFMNIKAKKFVFAMGGIENSRFLLWFASKYDDKFFSTQTPIGKYWMEHPHFTLGRAIVDKSLASPSTTSYPYYHRFYSLVGEVQKRAGILNCGLRVGHLPESAFNLMIDDLLCVAPTLGKKVANLAKKNLVCSVELSAAWEQAPDINNKITLTSEKDNLGVPHAQLEYRKNALDRKTVKETVKTFNDWLVSADLGRINIADWLLNDKDYPADDQLGGNHHMGGTRMHASEKFGVVDANCKVYGSQNLYMAGSSIYTTGGHTNPTLPIVQLALRLKDHLSSIV